VPLHPVESKLLQTDHCDVLREALRDWHLPKHFAVPLVSHHLPAVKLRSLPPEEAAGAVAVALANRIAHALLLGSNGSDVIYPIDDLVDLAGLGGKQLAAIAAEAPEETQTLRITMLAASASSDWPEVSRQVRDRLQTPFRPLLVALKPEVSAYRLFFEQVSGGADVGPPNIGVIHLRDVSELEPLAGQFEAKEREAEVTGLPILLILDRGKPNSDDAWLRTRRHAVLKSPIHITAFLEGVNALLASNLPV